MTDFQSPAVKAAYDAVARPARDGLLCLRALIFEVAKDLPVGRVCESLKWGQPSYHTPDTKAATPIRLALSKNGNLAILTHCQSSVMSDFRSICPPAFEFDGNRALHLSPDAPIPTGEITPLIRAALTYRL